MEANLRAATIAAGVNAAAAAARRENGDYGYLVYADGPRAGDTYRDATAEDAAQALDPDAPFVVDGHVKVWLHR